jgi:hypothetical protein
MMKLKGAYARVYKSFNYDILRKAHPEAKKRPWEDFRGDWYPYIVVPVDRDITTVVGANESGKSHLLSGIKKAITGQDITQRDLCRYSPFFNVEAGAECWPHLITRRKRIRDHVGHEGPPKRLLRKVQGPGCDIRIPGQHLDDGGIQFPAVRNF